MTINIGEKFDNNEDDHEGIYCKNGHEILCNLGNLVKNLMSNLPQPCTNHKNGCEEILMKENLSQHELICDYQKINCAVVNCKNEDICYLTYLDHFDKAHNLPIMDLQKKLDFNFNIFENHLDFVWKPKRFLAFNKTFFEVGFLIREK